MTHWIRFEHVGSVGFGTLFGESIQVYEGDMVETPEAAGQELQRSDVGLLPPVHPGKLIAVWSH